MEQFLDDALAELESSDCGCGGKSKVPARSSAADDLPTLDELNEALGALDGGPATAATEDDGLLAELELAADDLEDPFGDLTDTAGRTTLEDLLELAENNPGLKLTISY